jgi:hypothetical protein
MADVTPLAGKQDRGDDAKQKKKKKKDKKDKKGVNKDKKHKDKDKRKKKNVGLDVTASDSEKRLQKAIERTEARRAQLEKEEQAQRQALEALRAELDKEKHHHMEVEPPRKAPTVLVIEDSEEENTTASSTTAPPTAKTSKAPKGARQQLKLALDKLEEALLFLHGVAQAYDAVGVKAAVDGHLLVVAEQRTALETHGKQALGATQQAQVQVIVDRLRGDALSALKTRLLQEAAGLTEAELEKREHEWKQERAIVALAEKNKPEQRHVISAMQQVVEERRALVRRMVQQQGQQPETTEQRKKMGGQLKSLLSIANNDQSDVLGLFNRTRAAMEAIDGLQATLEDRYGAQGDLPQALAQKLELLQAKWRLVMDAWTAREAYVARVADSGKKPEKDRLMAPAVTNLPLVQELLLEISDVAMLVDVQQHSTAPVPTAHYLLNPYKLFAVSFDPAANKAQVLQEDAAALRVRRTQLYTKDQRGQVLHQNDGIDYRAHPALRYGRQRRSLPGAQSVPQSALAQRRLGGAGH